MHHTPTCTAASEWAFLKDSGSRRFRNVALVPLCRNEATMMTCPTPSTSNSTVPTTVNITKWVVETVMVQWSSPWLENTEQYGEKSSASRVEFYSVPSALLDLTTPCYTAWHVSLFTRSLFLPQLFSSMKIRTMPVFFFSVISSTPWTYRCWIKQLLVEWSNGLASLAFLMCKKEIRELPLRILERITSTVP